MSQDLQMLVRRTESPVRHSPASSSQGSDDGDSMTRGPKARCTVLGVLTAGTLFSGGVWLGFSGIFVHQQGKDSWREPLPREPLLQLGRRGGLAPREVPENGSLPCRNGSCPPMPLLKPAVPIAEDTVWRTALPYLTKSYGTKPPSWYSTVDLIKDPRTAHYLHQSQILPALHLGSGVSSVDDIPFRMLKRPQYHPTRHERIVLFSMYTSDGSIPADVRYLVSQLNAQRDGVYGIIATDAGGFFDKTVAPEALSLFRGVILRQNRGLDFSAFAHMLRIFPELWDANELTFTNDSNFGPLSLTDFGHLFARSDQSNSSFIGLTESTEGPDDTERYHLQSFFYTLKREALRHPGVQKFWLEQVFSFPNTKKSEIISRYELGMTQAMLDLGLKTEALFALPTLSEKRNPSILDAEQLIQRGYPFLKKSLFRFGALAPYLKQVNLSALETTFPFNLTEHVGHGHLSVRRLVEPSAERVP